jgi:predicted Zn finger-like uncharacterized protein
MVEVTCEKCGTPHRFEDADVPPSGKVVACKSCGSSVTVMPPSAAAMGMKTPARKATSMGLGGGARPPAIPGLRPGTPPPIPARKPAGPDRASGPALAAFEDDAPERAGDTGDVIDLGPSGPLDGAAKPARPSPLAGARASKPASEPRSPLAGADIPDLPAPKRETSDIIDLPAPVDDFADLPAPKRDSDFFADSSIDLPAPAQESSDIIDLPAPVDDFANLPAPKRDSDFFADSSIDLPAPVDDGPNQQAPRGGKDLSDLPRPVGPASKREVSDLPRPVGPTSKKEVSDLPRPVGRTSNKASDLPAPKGFFDDVPQPAGGAASVDLPAPKGFFDDAPAPKRPSAPGDGGLFDDVASPATAGTASLDLDDLELAPPSGGDTAEPLDLSTEDLELEPSPGAGGGHGGGADMLDLDGGLELEVPGSSGAPPSLELEAVPPAGSAGADYGNLDLPGAPDDGDDDVITFKPSSKSAPRKEAASLELARPSQAPARARADDNAAIELDDEAAPDVVARASGAPTAAARAAARAEREEAAVAARQKAARRKRIVAIAALGVVLAGAGGYLGYQKWQERKDRAATIQRSVNQARQALRAGEPGHWDKAAQAAERALAAAPDDAAAAGLAVQAYYAGIIDEGTNATARRAKGDALSRRITGESLQGPEITKAEALRAIVDGLPGRAVELLQGLLRTSKNDPDALLYLGWAYAGLENWPEAAAAFQRAADASPSRKAPAVYGLARAQLAMGDRAAARENFRKVIVELDQKNHVGALVGAAQASETTQFGQRENEYLAILRRKDIEQADPRAVALAYALAGDEALRAGRTDEARRRYDKALEHDGNSTIALIGKAKAALRAGQLAESRDKLESLLQLRPGDPDATLTLAEVAAAQGQASEAQTLADAIIAGESALITDTARARAHLIRGEVLAADEAQRDGAIADYEQARKLAGAGDIGIEATIALAELYTRMGPDGSRQALELLQPIEQRASGDPALAVTLGVAYLSAGDGAAAATWFRKALDSRPDDIEARFQLGKALLAQGLTDEAVATMREAYQADPGREDIGLRLAIVYEELERDPEAGALYGQLLARKEPAVNVQARAGRFYARTGEADKAGALGEAILTEQPNHATGLYLRGEGAYGRGDYEAALRDFQQAVALDQAAQYLDALGRTFEAQNRPEDAMRAYTRANEQDPTYLNPLMGRARVHIMRTEYNKAIELLEKAAADADTTPAQKAEIHTNLGLAYQRKGDKRKAVDQYRTALRHADDDAFTWYRLGETYYDLDRPADAAASLTRATALADDDAAWLTEAWRKLAYAQRNRDRRAAINAFEEYLARDPSGAEAIDAKKELRWLKENIRR